MQNNLAGKKSELSNVGSKVVTLEAGKAVLNKPQPLQIEHAQGSK